MFTWHGPVTNLGAPYRTRLRLPPWYGKDQSAVVNYACMNLWYTGTHSKFGDPLPWTELCSDCIPACAPLPECFFGDLPVGKVTKRKFTLSISSVVSQLFLCPACVGSHTLSVVRKQQGFPAGSLCDSCIVVVCSSPAQLSQSLCPACWSDVGSVVLWEKMLQLLLWQY